MLSLYVEAPFAACRSFTAGWYRPTATFLTPSSVYGLLLNLAGIETRLREDEELHPGSVPSSLTQPDLPTLRLAIGVSTVRRFGRSFVEIPENQRFPNVQTVFQQLHNYPVGSSGGNRADSAFGNKYNISPVRRELLVGVKAVIIVDGNVDLETRIQRGLKGELSDNRYGLPFLGDNSFLPDRIDLLDEPPSAHWYQHITEDDLKIRPRTNRFTIWIDRADLSQTRSDLYAPTEVPTVEIPDSAWTQVPSSPN